MSKNINFLTIRNREKVKKKKGVKAIRITAVFSLIAILCLSVLVYYLNRRIYPQALKNERDSLLKSISSLHNKEAKYAILANRVENILELLNKRVDYSKHIAKFSEKIPSGITVDTFKIDKKTITLTISSPSLKSIDEFINGLIVLGKEKEITVLLLDSLSMSEASGAYLVSLTANL